MDRAPLPLNENPFSSRYIRPGAIPFIFPTAMDAEGLLRRFLSSHHRRFAIVGPHGSGKSTLLHELARSLGPIVASWNLPRSERPGAFFPFQDHPKDRKPYEILWLRLQSSRCETIPWRDLRLSWQPRRILFVDGYEQMSSLERFKLHRLAMRPHRYLLATSHSRSWLLTTLYRTQLTREIERAVLAQLLQGSSGHCDGTFLERAWELSRKRHPDNLRESLFCMYDAFEERIRQHPIECKAKWSGTSRCQGESQVDSRSSQGSPVSVGRCISKGTHSK